MTLLCDDGTKSTVYLTAEAQDTEVYLSTSQVSLPNTYLGLQSEAQFTLHNNSDVPVSKAAPAYSETVCVLVVL